MEKITRPSSSATAASVVLIFFFFISLEIDKHFLLYTFSVRDRVRLKVRKVSLGRSRSVNNELQHPFTDWIPCQLSRALQLLTPFLRRCNALSRPRPCRESGRHQTRFISLATRPRCSQKSCTCKAGNCHHPFS